MAKKSARQTHTKDVTRIPGSAGPSPNAGIVKRRPRGGGQADKRLTDNKGK